MVIVTQYHGTHRDNFDSILEHGLRATYTCSEEGNWASESAICGNQPTGVYFSNGKWNRWGLVTDSDYISIVVDVTGLPLYKDGLVWDGWYTTDDIPPDRIIDVVLPKPMKFIHPPENDWN